MRDLPWAGAAALAEVADGGAAVVLRHWLMLTWPGVRHGALQLFGHAHGRWLGSRSGVNVGMDAWDCRPVMLMDALSRAATLPVNKRWANVELRRREGAQ